MKTRWKKTKIVKWKVSFCLEFERVESLCFSKILRKSPGGFLPMDFRFSYVRTPPPKPNPGYGNGPL